MPTILSKDRNWVDSVFDSLPRRAVEGRSRPTQRYFNFCRSSNQIVYAEGGNEQTALLMLEHFWRINFVRRFKFQPFCLNELNFASRAVPDILVELSDGSLHVIQIKSAKYLTSDVLRELSDIGKIISAHGFSYHTWTDRDKLNRDTWHNARNIGRGCAFTVSVQERTLLREAVKRGPITLKSLVTSTDFSQDQVFAGLAEAIIHIDITRKIDENSQIHASLPESYYSFLFEKRHGDGGWWHNLPDSVDESWQGVIE